ncbi:hypothetical protein Adt_30680 [Abeliophyllum distichum]|uniref:Dirigent protein n=1 Tax=Abeliophyllum distichum TaxID=126358 RepID=A0ABD1RD03_9LAMI
MGKLTGDHPVVECSVKEVTIALGARPRSAAIWVLFFGVGAEFDGVRPGMGTTRVIEGSPSMVKSESGGFGVGSTITNRVLVSGVSYVNQLIEYTLFSLNSNF